MRILEIGEHSLFKRAWPERTQFVHAASDFEQLSNPPVRDIDSRGAIALRRAIRNGAFELIVLHAPAHAPWSLARLRQCAASRRHGRRGALARSILPFATGGSPIPIVVLDMEDQPLIYRHNLRLLDRCKAYFKRELPTDHARLFMRERAPALPTEAERRDARMRARVEKLRPISIGVPAEVPPDLAAGTPKETDVFFAGRWPGSSTVRDRGIEELRELARAGYRIDIAEVPLSRAEYLRRCARAHLVWSPEGFGWDCFRHYEAAACRSVPLIGQPAIHRYRPLLEGIHCHHYAVEPGGLARAVRLAMKHPERLRRMAAAGRRHVLRHHTHPRLCEYIVKTTFPGASA